MARTDNLSNFLTDVSNAIKAKKGDETPIPAKNFDTEIENMQTGGGISPRNIKNLQIKIEPTSIGLKFDSPDDTKDHRGGIYCSLGGVKVIKRDDEEIPLNEEDGTLVEDVKEKNKYQNDYLIIDNLVTDKKYSFGLFPYSDKEVYNVNEVNCITATPTAVDFATATDEQLATILNAHYQGLLDIADYWNVGDTRVMHLSAMAGGSGGEAHVEQDMTMVIVAINHDDLKEQIGTRTKAAVTLQCREVLANKGTAENGQNYGGTGQWSANPRRTWLNNTFAGALPSGIQSLLKTVIKKNLANHTNNTAGTDTEDKVFFPSYPEMFGSASYSYYKGSQALEGQQYPYYNSNAKRIKYNNNNGTSSGTANLYWLRSPSSFSSDRWIRVYSDGSASDDYSSYTLGVAPAFCL